MGAWERLAQLRVTVDEYTTERRLVQARAEFERVTTTLVLTGQGQDGRGEDIGYVAADHDSFPDARSLGLVGSRTLGEACALLEGIDLFAGADPRMPAARDYRRWAFESALCDLALRQAGTSLGAAVGRAYRPVRFVVSNAAWIDLDETLELKLDTQADWDRARIERLAATGRVAVVDFKAHYHGTPVDTEFDERLYRDVAECLGSAVLEDPDISAQGRAALAGHDDRFAFDAPVHSLADLDALGIEVRHANVKPSRFGSLERLLEFIEACDERGIAMYGGGQFELGVGRLQIQSLASLFYPDGPNDVAPAAYNDDSPGIAYLPRSPLPLPSSPAGFGYTA
jgi:hypothetical protein